LAPTDLKQIVSDVTGLSRNNQNPTNCLELAYLLYMKLGTYLLPLIFKKVAVKFQPVMNFHCNCNKVNTNNFTMVSWSEIN